MGKETIKAKQRYRIEEAEILQEYKDLCDFFFIELSSRRHAFVIETSHISKIHYSKKCWVFVKLNK